MHERSASTPAGTIAWIFRNSKAAEEGARNLRAAGFSDARVSESAGSTRDETVPENAGMLASDFEKRLTDAGFRSHDARSLTDAVRDGGVLLTLAAGTRVDRAFAVLRGETVPADTLSPVDVPVVPAIADGAVVPAAATDEKTVELREERLAIAKREEEREARIRKETVVEQRTITVPVRREQLVVERDGQDDVRIPIDDDGR